MEVALTKVYALSQISALKDSKPHPKELSEQYDNALEESYLNYWPKAVPEYDNEHRCCCCCRDPERDNHSREVLQKIFPPYLFHFLTFAGAIPPRSKSLLYFFTGYWIFFGFFPGYIMLTSSSAFTIRLFCNFFDENCQVAGFTQFGFTAVISLFFFHVPALLSIVLVHTYLRDLLQSRELQTLISSIGADRMRKPEDYW